MSENHNTVDKPTFINASRRGFLQGAAVAGGAAAAGATVASDAIQQPEDSHPSASNGKGYEVTEHITKYYERVRF